MGLGCWGLGGDAYGQITEDSSKEILNVAQSEGTRFFDTSPSYGFGLSETRLGSFLTSKRDKLIATKVGLNPHTGTEMPFDLSEKGMRLSLAQSLQRLRVDALSLVQIHSPPLDVLEHFPNLIADLDRIRSEGTVVDWGISLRNPSHVKFFSKLFPWVSYQVNFSLIDQRAMPIFENLSLNKSKIIARTPLNFGFLTENFNMEAAKRDAFSHLSKWSMSQLEVWQKSADSMKKVAREWDMKIQHLALRFVLDSGIADIMIPGVMSTTELKENLLALKAPQLESWQISRLRDIYEDIEKDFRITTPFEYKLRGH